MGERTIARSCVHWVERNSMDSSHVQPQQHSASPGTAALIDPVCGMKVSDGTAHVAEFEGQKYSFCSAGCRSKFLADPAKYIGAGKPATSARASGCCAHKAQG